MSNLSMPVTPPMGGGVGLSDGSVRGPRDGAFGDTLDQMLDESGVSTRPMAVHGDHSSVGASDSRAGGSDETTESAAPEASGLRVFPLDAAASAEPGGAATWLSAPNMLDEPGAPLGVRSAVIPEGQRGVFPPVVSGEDVLQETGLLPGGLLPRSPNAWMDKAATVRPDPAALLRSTPAVDPRAELPMANAVGAAPELAARGQRALKEPAVLLGALGRGVPGAPEGFLAQLSKGVGLPTEGPRAAQAVPTVHTEGLGSGFDVGPETPGAERAPVSIGRSPLEAQRAVQTYAMPDSLQQIRRLGPDGQTLSMGEGPFQVPLRAGGAASNDGAAQVAMPPVDEGTLQDLADQVRAQLRVMASRGRERVTLQLHPASLGKLKLQVSLERQTVVAEMMTDSIAVRDLVNAQLQTLKESLMDQGFQLERFAVQLQDETAGQGSREGAGTFREAFRESLGGRPGGQSTPEMPAMGPQNGGSITPEGRVNLFV